MKIGSLIIDPPVLLAPMAGITDSPYRQVARSLGCPAVVTEMVSAEGIRRKGKGSLDLLIFDSREHPVIAQIFGSRPESMAEAARVCHEKGFDGVDINMGCPVPKVVRNGAGCALMREPGRAVEVVTAVRRAIPIPLTVKLRAGWDAREINVVELSKRLSDAGVDGLTVHPRTRTQFYGGATDWSLIGQVVKAVGVTVIGNGDLRTPEDVRQMMDRTGCAGVMVGRAALGNPWLPAAMGGSSSDPAPSPGELYRVFCIHLEKMIDWVGSERRAVLRMRKHLVWYTRGIPGAASLRRILSGMDSAAVMKRALRDLLSID